MGLTAFYKEEVEPKGKYLGYLVKHRYKYIKPARELGLGWKPALTHDIDKFVPSRFDAYADWFYGPKGIKGTADESLRKHWRDEVTKHYKRSPHHRHKLNRHHTEQSAREAIADWYATGNTKNVSPMEFYEMNKGKFFKRASLAMSDIEENVGYRIPDEYESQVRRDITRAKNDSFALRHPTISALPTLGIWPSRAKQRAKRRIAANTSRRIRRDESRQYRENLLTILNNG